MSANSFKRILVALNLPLSVSAFIIRIQAIILAMKSSPYFTGLSEKITKLETLNQGLINAETACNTTPPSGSIEARNAQWELVKTQARIMRNEVQNIADEDPANAATIIASAAMEIKKEGTREKQKNTVENGTEPHSVILTAEGPGYHNWRYSYNNEEWTYVPGTSKATTIIRNLQVDVICYFQNCRVLPNNETTEWSESIKIRIK